MLSGMTMIFAGDTTLDDYLSWGVPVVLFITMAPLIAWVVQTAYLKSKNPTARVKDIAALKTAQRQCGGFLRWALPVAIGGALASSAEAYGLGGSFALLILAILVLACIFLWERRRS